MIINKKERHWAYNFMPTVIEQMTIAAPSEEWEKLLKRYKHDLDNIISNRKIVDAIWESVNDMLEYMDDMKEFPHE